MKLLIKMVFRILIVAILINSLEAEDFFKTTDKVVRHNILVFNNDQSLICSLTSNVFSNAMLVDKDNYWSIYKNRYFKKRDLLINIFNCQKAKDLK